MDGIIGLFPFRGNTIKPGNASDVLTNLFFGPDQHPESAVFTVSLTRPTEPDGFFTFGYIDQQYTGNNAIDYIPVINRGEWEVPSQYVVINGQRFERNGSDEESVPTTIIDTGTIVILVSDDILPVIYKSLNGIYNATYQA